MILRRGHSLDAMPIGSSLKIKSFKTVASIAVPNMRMDPSTPRTMRNIFRFLERQINWSHATKQDQKLRHEFF